MAKATSSIGAENAYPFIVSNGPGSAKFPAIRTLVRKQAMKEIGCARRRRGNYGRVNLGQPVVFEQSDSRLNSVIADPGSHSTSSSATKASGASASCISSNSTEISSLDCEDQTKCMPVRHSRMASPVKLYIPPSLGAHTGYERVRAAFCVDLPQLSMLTNFNVGKSAIPILSTDALRLAALMEQQQWSYLEYVPQLYDWNTCLAAVTDCVLAKVSNILMPDLHNQRLELRLYSKALRTLQDAIADPASLCDAHVLCAIQLMSLHELLDSSRGSAWSSHVHASARLVKHRTPGHFKSDFEKALFVSHVGPVVSEAFLNKTPCYLDQSEWTELYMSLTKESVRLTYRSELVMKARKLIFALPGLWHDIDETMRKEDHLNDTMLTALEARCRKLHIDLLEWLEEFKVNSARTSPSQQWTSELSLRRELLGIVLDCLIFVKRLLATVCDADRINLEMEVQSLARFMLDLQHQPSPKHSWLFTGHEMLMSLTAIITTDLFTENLCCDTREHQRLAMCKRYLLWSRSSQSP